MRRSKEAASDSFNCPFESLKDIRGKLSREQKKPATVPPAAEPSDDSLFREAMKDVREIREFRQLRTGPRREIAIRQPGAADVCVDAALREVVSGRAALDLSQTQEYVAWLNPACKADVLSKLGEGRFSVQDSLDLHGLFLEDAEEMANVFLKDALRRRLRCIKIIHGRGLRSPRGPVIKAAIIRLLSMKYRRQVLAFVSARQCDGGLGALYVLFR